jgi:23S rRNA (cytidine1920-2'-O)/16S rRNA (cytidine1409-2'-O)-methyltransferase
MLVYRKLVHSRSRGRDAILRKCVWVNGIVAKGPGQKVSDNDEIFINDRASNYVSRAALKLLSAFDICKFDITGKTCLDIGASTGGFTQVLLEKGATHVIAIDVGHDQMASKIADDARVDNLEGVNARDLDEATISVNGKAPKLEVIVSDVSFISIKLALPPALQLAEPGAVGIFLVKPQFEAGRENIGKGGLLKSPTLGLEIAKNLVSWLDRQPDWLHTHLLPSSITGSDGNQEFLLCGRKHHNDKTQAGN